MPLYKGFKIIYNMSEQKCAHGAYNQTEYEVSTITVRKKSINYFWHIFLKIYFEITMK